MSRSLDVAASWSASIARLGAGMSAAYAVARQPEKLLELYEFEACPFCRKLREVLTAFDLDAMIYPCPRGGERFRPKAAAAGGKAQFPYLVDPNTGKAMYESMEIAQYLADTYGSKVPFWAKLGPFSTAGSALASAWRPGHGRAARPSKAPEKPLELWSMEASPYCRLAKETLSELEIPYVLHNVGKGSPKRAAFIARSGKMMVPYLADPNTGKEMHESAEIMRYLDATYGA